MFSFEGKRALVTGASGGIGGAIAEQLHSQGAHIVISGTNETVLHALAGKLGGRVDIAVCNLGDPQAVSHLFAQAEEKAGPIDILVNNAGITRDGLALRMKDEDWQVVLDVNLTAAFRLSRAAIKSMMKRRYGRIINVTSIVGHTGNAGQTNYSAAKAGLVGMTKALAQEVAARAITVNCVAPGYIRTAMTDKLPADVIERIITGIPAGRAGLPGDVASSVVFLASEEAGYITGETIHVNGGMAMI